MEVTKDTQAKLQRKGIIPGLESGICKSEGIGQLNVHRNL